VGRAVGIVDGAALAAKPGVSSNQATLGSPEAGRQEPERGVARTEVKMRPRMIACEFRARQVGGGELSWEPNRALCPGSQGRALLAFTR